MHLYPHFTAKSGVKDIETSAKGNSNTIPRYPLSANDRVAGVKIIRGMYSSVSLDVMRTRSFLRSIRSNPYYT